MAFLASGAGQEDARGAVGQRGRGLAEAQPGEEAVLPRSESRRLGVTFHAADSSGEAVRPCDEAKTINVL